jgi:hypothetical protein
MTSLSQFWTLIMNLSLDFSFKQNSQMSSRKTSKIRSKESTSKAVMCEEFRPKQLLMPGFSRSDFYTKRRSF